MQQQNQTVAAVSENLLRLRQQLDLLARTPTVNGAQSLLLDAAPMLEPVWSVTGSVEGVVDAVGFLRRLGCQKGTERNTAVLQNVTATFGALDLVAPTRKQIWEALARPAQALLSAVGEELEPDPPESGTLRVAPLPRLPDELLNDNGREEVIVPLLRQVLRAWCDIARHATGARREIAQLTLAAALLARGAALDGDTETVRWFVSRWLGLAPTETRVDGTIAALFSDGWRRSSVDTDFSDVQDIVTDLRMRAISLRREAKRQHRLHRPVWETQLRGAPVTMLWDMLPGENGSLPLVDAIVTPEGDAADHFTKAILKEQIESVLDTLTPMEAKTIRFAYIDDMSWVDIAHKLGITRYSLDKIRKRAFEKLRHESRSSVLRDYL